MYALGHEFVPKGLTEIIDKRLGGVIGLDTRHCHPCGHRRHIEDISPTPLDHVFPKETAQFGDRYHMQIEHKLNATHRGLAIGVEEEHAGVIDKGINNEVIGLTISEELLRCVLLAEVSVLGDGLNAILLMQFSGDGCQFSLLVTNEQEVALVVTRQLGGVLQAYSGACAGY